MKNKIKLKKFLIIIAIFLFVMVFLFLMLIRYEHSIYKKNYSNKLAVVLSKVKEKYPNISEKELLKDINSASNKEIKDDKNAILYRGMIKDDKEFRVFKIVEFAFFVVTMFGMVCLFLAFNSKKDKEINSITKYIEEINKKNYKLELDDMSEDELSILKNEIYKTTIMLKEMAENSNKEKLELKKSLSDISHQLKTPLTSIIIILDNLIDEPDMDIETREDFIWDIKREIHNIDFLVQTILKLSKLDTNTIKFIRRDESVNRIIDEAVKNTSILGDLKGVGIKKDIEDNFEIKCDFKWQVEAISNILKNCIEHSFTNTFINVSARNKKVYSEIVIKDNGKGIDKEDLSHIFERFYKGKNASFDSIGIGLSLAKSIIEKDNGKIEVETDDKGTSFIIKYYRY